MSSIVLPGFLVSMGFPGPLAERRSWPKTDSGSGLLRSTGLVRRSVTAVLMGTFSVKTRGGCGTSRNLATDPGVLTIDDRAPSSLGGGGENTRDGKTPDSATPRHAHAFDQRSMDADVANARRSAHRGAAPCLPQGGMRQKVRTVK